MELIFGSHGSGWAAHAIVLYTPESLSDLKEFLIANGVKEDSRHQGRYKIQTYHSKHHRNRHYTLWLSGEIPEWAKPFVMEDNIEHYLTNIGEWCKEVADIDWGQVPLQNPKRVRDLSKKCDVAVSGDTVSISLPELCMDSALVRDIIRHKTGLTAGDYISGNLWKHTYRIEK